MADDLSSEEARPLTDREISKILCGVLGGLAEWNKAEDLVSAIEFLHRNKERLRQFWSEVDKSQGDPDKIVKAFKTIRRPGN